MAFVTWGHHSLIAGNRRGAIIGTLFTIILAILFTALQYIEYSEASFSIADSVYGTVFFASTGLHGSEIKGPYKFVFKNISKTKKIQYKIKIVLRTFNSKSTKFLINLKEPAHTDTINAPEISPLKVEGGWREGGIHDKLLIEFKPRGEKIKTFYL